MSTDQWENFLTEQRPETTAARLDRRPARRRRRRVVIVLAILLTLLLAGLAAVGAYVWSLKSTFEDGVTTVAIPDDRGIAGYTAPPAVLTGAANYLLLGSDTRASDRGVEEGGPSDQRSDTIMYVHIPADHASVQVMSIMRDMWVDVPGHGEAKINSALAFGGIPLVVATVEQFTQSRIDHVAVIDFASFRGLTDAVGGVTLTNDQAFTTLHGDDYIPAGRVTLNGEEALGFVRERYSFTDGDYQRVRNQQKFLKALTAKILSAESLSSPATVSKIVSTISPFLVVDKGLDAASLASIGWSLRSVRASDIGFFTAPSLGTGTRGDQSVVLVDEPAMAEISTAIANDTLGQYAARG